MERNWDLAPCGRTEVPKESPSEATSENALHLQWGLKTVLLMSKNTKASVSSESLRKCTNVWGYKSLSSEGIGKYFKACKWRLWRHRKWFKVTKTVADFSPTPHATVILMFQRFRKPILNFSRRPLTWWGIEIIHKHLAKGKYLSLLKPKLMSKTSVPCACSLYDQTRDYCGCWPETYEGCPYRSCKRYDA